LLKQNSKTGVYERKAAVCYEFGKPLLICEVELDPPKVGEGKVKVAATAIFRSDVLLAGGDGQILPIAAGHCRDSLLPWQLVR